MAEVARIEAPRRRRRTSAAALRWSAAAIVVAAAAVMLILRVPGAFDSFRSSAAATQGRNTYAGALAGADSLGIDNPFVAAAVDTLPTNAGFAVLLPASSAVAQQNYGIAGLTYQALPEFMREVLLPRLPTATPGKGDYVLCYDCDTSPWDARTHWLWTDSKGHAIGLVQK